MAVSGQTRSTAFTAAHDITTLQQEPFVLSSVCRGVAACDYIANVSFKSNNVGCPARPLATRLSCNLIVPTFFYIVSIRSRVRTHFAIVNMSCFATQIGPQGGRSIAQILGENITCLDLRCNKLGGVYVCQSLKCSLLYTSVAPSNHRRRTLLDRRRSQSFVRWSSKRSCDYKIGLVR